MKKRLWRGLAAALCGILLLGAIPARAVSTSAVSAVLMDVDSGRILYASNENERRRIASTTKIMTALVAIENGDLDAVWTVKRPETLVEGTSMYLREGDQLTLETMLYGLLLCSGNDAALAIADAVGGSQERFVAMMNQKAKELGMTNSSFANPNGLDADGHYSTALDMAKLACAAVENETLVRIASTRSVVIGGRTMKNHNKLLTNVEGCIGLKTGYTRAAGRTLVSCAERNGQRLAAVTLYDHNDWADHQALYEYGFSAYPAQQAVSLGEILTRVPVEGGTNPEVPLAAAETVSWPVGENEELTVRLEVPEKLTAPVRRGERAGEAAVLLDGREVARTALLCGGDSLTEAPEPMSLFQRLKLGLTA